MVHPLFAAKSGGQIYAHELMNLAQPTLSRLGLIIGEAVLCARSSWPIQRCFALPAIILNACHLCHARK